MKTAITLIISILIITSCAFMRNPVKVTDHYLSQAIDWQERSKSQGELKPTGTKKQLYYESLIETWQGKIKKEGWSVRLVHKIYWDSIFLASYKGEGNKDYWMTYNEFIKADFKGDCEDIAAYIFGTFKRLEYPYQTRIRVVMGSLGDHALISIEMPGGKWKVFESVLLNIVGGEFIWYRPVCEFDLNEIYFVEVLDEVIDY